jgi:putative MFS transporter
VRGRGRAEAPHPSTRIYLHHLLERRTARLDHRFAARGADRPPLGLDLVSLIGIAVSAAYVSVTDSALIAGLGFFVTCVIYVLSSLSIACYVPELFPTEVRLRGSGVANAAGRAVNILVPYAVAASFESFGLYGVFGLIAAALLLQIVVLLTIGIETKQRSLEDLATDAGEATGVTPLLGDAQPRLPA